MSTYIRDLPFSDTYLMYGPRNASVRQTDAFSDYVETMVCLSSRTVHIVRQ